MGRYEVSLNAAAGVSGKRAVFLDRDGVLNRPVVRDGKPYPPVCLSEFELYPDVLEACLLLKEAGFLLVLATNQPDVGRGTLERERVEEMHRYVRGVLPLDQVEVCFHGGAGYGESCLCRKPLPGMLEKAARELGVDLGRSWMVGDRWRDIDCGVAAGCKTVFLQRNYAEGLKAAPDFIADSLMEASKVILSVRI